MDLLFEACAVGEITVGIAVALFPRAVSALLLGAPIADVGAVIARLAGVAIAMLGLTWWLARGDLDTRLTSIAPGFFGYNIGAGLLFLSYALGATAPVTVAWLVAAAHLLVAFTFFAAVLVRRRRIQIN
jgi:hypothetical protein